jgi:hypothetical protein
VINVIPVSHPPSARYAVGNKSRPDQPTNTNLSLFNQSSRTSNHPRCDWEGVCKTEEVIASFTLLYIFIVMETG